MHNLLFPQVVISFGGFFHSVHIRPPAPSSQQSGRFCRTIPGTQHVEFQVSPVLTGPH